MNLAGIIGNRLIAGIGLEDILVASPSESRQAAA